MSVAEIAETLEPVSRKSAAADNPEGSFSDTALYKMARELRLAAGDRPDVESM
jgi:hypothetical protein